jgi:hypothetical protein
VVTGVGGRTSHGAVGSDLRGDEHHGPFHNENLNFLFDFWTI